MFIAHVELNGKDIQDWVVVVEIGHCECRRLSKLSFCSSMAGCLLLFPQASADVVFGFKPIILCDSIIGIENKIETHKRE